MRRFQSSFEFLQEHIQWKCHCSFIKCHQLNHIYQDRFGISFVIVVDWDETRVFYVKIEHKVQFEAINILRIIRKK